MFRGERLQVTGVVGDWMRHNPYVDGSSPSEVAAHNSKVMVGALLGVPPEDLNWQTIAFVAGEMARQELLESVRRERLPGRQIQCGTVDLSGPVISAEEIVGGILKEVDARREERAVCAGLDQDTDWYKIFLREYEHRKEISKSTIDLSN